MNHNKCRNNARCRPNEAEVLAQNYGFSVRQCTCGKIALQVGPVTLNLEPNALLCLAALLEEAATALMQKGVELNSRESTHKHLQRTPPPSFEMPLQTKKWVH